MFIDPIMFIDPALFRVRDYWGRHSKLVTAKQLLDQIVCDSKSDYGWFTSATELVRVVNSKRFPIHESVIIKFLILQCFTRLERNYDRHTRQRTTDPLAVQKCFNTLPNTPGIIVAKQAYLKALISGTAKRFADNGGKFGLIFAKNELLSFLSNWENLVEKSYTLFEDESGNIDILEWRDWLRTCLEYQYRQIHNKQELSRYLKICNLQPL